MTKTRPPTAASSFLMADTPSRAPLPVPVDGPNGDHRPNLLLFMPDQLRYDALGCTQVTSSGTGPPPGVLQTPNLDAFRARGTLFTECYAQASVCAQSRCSMFSGRYPHVAGHRSLEHLLQPWEPNVFRSLKAAGYHVACLAPRGDTFAPTVTELSVDEYGFLGEGPEPGPGKKPENDDDDDDDTSLPFPSPLWDRLFYKGRRSPAQAADYDDALVRSALAWLQCPPTDRPWVLFLPLLFPHCPFTVEEPFFSQYDRARVGSAVSATPAAKTGHEPRYMAAVRARYGITEATDAHWRELRATYYGMVARLDAQFGRIVDALDATGLWTTTVTLFCTDHGEYLGDHGLVEKWPSGLSASLLHEPLLVAGAGLPAGRTVDAMAEMVDLVPTLLALAGVAEHFPHNGRSWVPLLLGATSVHKDAAYSEGGFLLEEEPLLEYAPFPYDRKAALQHEDTALVGKAVSRRCPRWVFVYRLYEPPELYDRATDPHEMHNLAALPKHVARVTNFERDVLRWLVATGDVLSWTRDPRFPPVDLPSPWEQMEERLRRAGKTWDDIHV